MILGLPMEERLGGAAWLELRFVPPRVPALDGLGRGAQQESGDISVLTPPWLVVTHKTTPRGYAPSSELLII